ncbi:endonuclease/exonuclease/phosphatase family protein [Streptomyces sp. NBC_01433]|uniref:endonuclease/exonuclease/phosphatase family protein n=1 Tax=Streptomyces sp. NBC_01433 TaxID=2903864 RepID=UPI00225AC580|nr:endonuclease/exonuclease/phosphatase family protein [Streptomyces sp. NBC_01433]MCX4681468.1 endonuclease/exonuclease/phosphatase family protein [Streptomyces sp. NBC_01433]
MSTAPLTLLSWNFENNGKKDPARRQAGDELLKSLNPDLVFRQELWDADENGRTVFNAQARTLGMHGELGDGSCTAVFINPRRFSVVRDWTQGRGPQFVLPPTALTLRYEEAGADALPFIAVSYHLNYASPTQRLLEAEWLTTWADRGWTTPNGTRVTLPAVFAGDNNSFPAPGADGDPALPELLAIKNAPHRLHRSYPGPDGARVPDTRPDAALRTAGLEDVARYWAATQNGTPAAVSRTVNACDTHGPDSRIDRAYATPELLPAVDEVDVIKVDADLSDHHILRIRMNAGRLAEILNRAAA